MTTPIAEPRRKLNQYFLNTSQTPGSAALAPSGFICGAIWSLSTISVSLAERFASADPTAISFSGELLAMVIIGGMRSFLGPALGALFFVIFRDNLSRLTEDWLLYFGLLFVAFIVFSPNGLVGLYERVTRRWRRTVEGEAAMASRQAGEVALPAFLKPAAHGEGPIIEAALRAAAPDIALLVEVWEEPGGRSQAMDVAATLEPFDLKNQLSSNRTQGIPNMIALIRETAQRLAA